MDEVTIAQKQALVTGQPQKTISLFNWLTTAGDPGKLAFQYAIAAYSEENDHQHALSLADTALQFNADDSVFLIKKVMFC